MKVYEPSGHYHPSWRDNYGCFFITTMWAAAGYKVFAACELQIRVWNT